MGSVSHDFRMRWRLCEKIQNSIFAWRKFSHVLFSNEASLGLFWNLVTWPLIRKICLFYVTLRTLCQHSKLILMLTACVALCQASFELLCRAALFALSHRTCVTPCSTVPSAKCCIYWAIGEEVKLVLFENSFSNFYTSICFENASSKFISSKWISLDDIIWLHFFPPLFSGTTLFPFSKICIVLSQ